MDKDDLFGLFQQFRPDGDGVASIFSELPNGDVYMQRLLAIYAATNEPENLGDAYFVVRARPAVDVPSVLDLGHQLIERMKRLAIVIDDPRLTESLNGLARVRYSEALPPRHRSLADDDWWLVEVIGDWLSTLKDRDALPVRLDEAYYSIACDYMLAWYLQWPYFPTMACRGCVRALL